MKHDGLYRASWVDSWVRQGTGWSRLRPCSCLVVFLGNLPLQPFYLFSYCFTSPNVLVVHFTFICTYLASIWSYYIALVNVGLTNMEQIE
jgi:hypothetical protein